MILDQIIIKQIKELAHKFPEIQKVTLFGSRARGDCHERSDIDLAIYTDDDISEFVYALETQVSTLLKFDISNMNEVTDTMLKNEIEKDGVVLYENS